MARKILWMVVLMFCLTAPAMARENVFQLDDANSFNIYIGSASGQTSVIRDVNIGGFREISGIVFVIVRQGSFAAKSTEGLVRLDAIQAILPTLRAPQVQQTAPQIQ